MEFPLNFSFLITIGCIFCLVYYTWKGFHNGFVLEAIITISLLLCILVGWFVSGWLMDRIFIVPSDIIDTGVSLLDALALSIINRGAWFIILLVVTNILLRLFRKQIRKINKIVIIGTLNKVLGTVLGFVKSLVYIMILMVVLSSPLFTNGKKAISNAGLLPVRTVIREHVPIARDLLIVFDKVDLLREKGVISSFHDGLK